MTGQKQEGSGRFIARLTPQEYIDLLAADACCWSNKAMKKAATTRSYILGWFGLEQEG